MHTKDPFIPQKPVAPVDPHPSYESDKTLKFHEPAKPKKSVPAMDTPVVSDSDQARRERAAASLPTPPLTPDGKPAVPELRSISGAGRLELTTGSGPGNRVAVCSYAIQAVREKGEGCVIFLAGESGDITVQQSYDAVVDWWKDQPRPGS